MKDRYARHTGIDTHGVWRWVGELLKFVLSGLWVCKTCSFRSLDYLKQKKNQTESRYRLLQELPVPLQGSQVVGPMVLLLTTFCCPLERMEDLMKTQIHDSVEEDRASETDRRMEEAK